MDSTDWALAISIVALAASVGQAVASSILAHVGNRIWSTDHVTETALTHVEREMHFCAAERRIYRTLLSTVFEDSAAKARFQERLRRIRDASARRLDRLQTLTGIATPLMEARARTESDTPSHLENGELVPPQGSDMQLAAYEKAIDGYVGDLRELNAVLCSRRWLRPPKRKSAFMKIVKKQTKR